VDGPEHRGHDKDDDPVRFGVFVLLDHFFRATAVAAPVNAAAIVSASSPASIDLPPHSAMLGGRFGAGFCKGKIPPTLGGEGTPAAP
jgi:hypothetical protein